ncbi:hypothetical protein EG329_014066 [Mollisiaceae sp. DMI_Dod_QoI]|nr:hypothetical protein EG329_014066 [Helotiales sp. DMI_Dod_QoI]
MPTEKLFTEAPPFPDNIPVANLSTLSLEKLLTGDEKESMRFFDACKNDGFFLLDLRHASIGASLLTLAEELFRVNEALFNEGPEELNKYTYPPPGILGYNAFGSTKVESGLPDRFEWYVLSQDDIMGTIPPNTHPASVESSRSILHPFITVSHNVVSQLLLLLDRHLCLPEGTLESRQKLDRESGTIVRFLKYPPQPEGDRRTSLFGGILRSNPHRVTFPPGEQANFTRYSVAYLMRAEAKASMKRLALAGSLIEPTKNGDREIEVTADEWVSQKTALARLAKDPASVRDGRAVKAY